MLVSANDHTRWISVLDPIHDAQHDAVIRFVDPVGTPPYDGTLSELPRARAPVTVSHAGYHEQPIERVHLASNSSSFDCVKECCDQNAFHCLGADLT